MPIFCTYFQRHPATLLSVVAAVAIAVSMTLQPSELPGLSLCAFQNATTLPCPGCGLSRAFCAIGHGDFAAAWAFHPFSFLFYGLALGLVLSPLWRRAGKFFLERVLNPTRVACLALVLVAALFVFGAWRLATLV